MLTPIQFEKIERQVSFLYSNLELEIIEEIAKRIANVGYANTVVLNDIKIAEEMGMIYQDIISLVATENNQSYEKIKDIFEDAGASSIEFDDRIYKEAGLQPFSLNQSPSMLQLLSATAKKTNYNLSNLVMTTANTAQTAFYDAINRAYMEVSTGVKSYSQSILDAINTINRQGPYVTYPSGKKMSVEAAVRTNIVTGINQTCGKLQEIRADEMECDLMEITAHAGARPSHALWQGRVVSRSGQSGYLSLADIGYGTVTGFKGINCHHDWMPFYKGISRRVYKDSELKEMANEKVTYNGKEMTKYDAMQEQRRMERTIRQDKKDLAGLDGILRSNTSDNKLIEDTRTAFASKTLTYNKHKSQLNDFLEQTNYKKDNTRLYVGKQEKNISIQTANVTKIANKYNNNIVGLQINDQLRVNSVSEHIVSRTYARNVEYETIVETLKNPLKYGKIRADKSQQVKGKNCTVVINTETGKLITVYPKKER